MTISGSARADHGFLSTLAAMNGGRYVNLRTVGPDRALEMLLDNDDLLTELLVDGEDRTELVEWWDDGRRFHLVVPVEGNSTSLNVRTASRRHHVPLPGHQQSRISSGNSLGAWWASRRLYAMKAQGESLDDRVVFARRHEVAFDNAVFVVFDSLFDYADAELPVPDIAQSVFAADDWNAYQRALAKRRVDRNRRGEARLQEVVTAWAAQVAWYNTIHRPPVEREAPGRTRVPQTLLAFSGETLQEEVVMGARISRREAAEFEEIIISVTPWSPDQPYLTAVEGLCGGTFIPVYFQTLRTWGNSPSFYLEMADAAFACGDVEFAVEVALSALETDLADAETRVAVAQRLTRFGAFEPAIDLFRQLAYADPERPQPHRNLALALAARARHDESDWWALPVPHICR